MQIPDYETGIQPSMYIRSDFIMDFQDYSSCSYLQHSFSQQSFSCAAQDTCNQWTSAYPAGTLISAFDPAEEAMAYPPMPAVNDPDAWMQLGPVESQEGAMVSFNTIDPAQCISVIDATAPSTVLVNSATADYGLAIQQPQALPLDASLPADHDYDSFSSSEADLSATGSPAGDESFDVDSIFGGNDVEERSVQVYARKGKSMSRSPVVITFERLAEHFHESLETAAAKIGIGKSTMKHVCRRLGIDKWPYTHKGHRKNRPRKPVHHQISASSIVFTDSHEFFDASTHPRMNLSAAGPVQGECQLQGEGSMFYSTNTLELEETEEDFGLQSVSTTDSTISEVDLNFLWDCVGRGS